MNAMRWVAERQDNENYRSRRGRLMEAMEGGVAVLRAPTRAHDLNRWRQQADIYYLTGCEVPNAVLWLDAQAGEEILFLPRRDPDRERWDGALDGPDEASAERLGIDNVLPLESGHEVLRARRQFSPGFESMLLDRLASSPRLWLRLPRIALPKKLSGEAAFAARLRDRAPSFELADLSPLLEQLRVRKDAGEIALIRKAVSATIAAQRAAAAAIAPGNSEGVAEGAAYGALKAAGAEGWSFTPIVATGGNGAVLHYDANLDRFAEGQLAVVDLGASYGGYAGDLTRTYPVSGRFSPRQLEVYEAVRRAHDEVVETIRPGDTITRMRDLAWESLQRSGVAGPQGAGLGEAFLHGLGHFIGLDVHDCGSESMTLEPGMVLTNEPGAYLADEGFGVRLENDLLITTAGVENLSADLPLHPDSVAAMVGGRTGS